MNTPSMPPSSDDELQTLAPLAALLYEGFESATERVCQFFEAEAEPVDPALYAPFVRHYMVRFLRDKGHVVDDFDQEALFNNGLCVTFAGRRIRMWKAEDDTLPPPGSSITKKAFLGQQLALFSGDGTTPITLNLVVLWNVDAHYHLGRLYLACPKSASQDGRLAESYWSCPIPHPATSIDASQVGPSEPESKDLPIGIREPEVASAEDTP